MEPADLEAWLGRVLVPVEPGDRFVTRLRGKLVELRGARPSRSWIGLAALLGLGLAAAMWFGIALRLALVGHAVVGLVANRRDR
jgi:hypothetical protein